MNQSYRKIGAVVNRRKKSICYCKLKVKILRIQYSHFAFDSQDCLQDDERQDMTRLSMDMIKTIQYESHNHEVINVRHQFAKKRLGQE